MIVHRPPVLPAAPQQRDQLLSDIEQLEQIFREALRKFFVDRDSIADPASLEEWFWGSSYEEQAKPLKKRLQAQGLQPQSIEDSFSYALYREAAHLASRSEEQRKHLFRRGRTLFSGHWADTAFDLLRWRPSSRQPSAHQLLEELREEQQAHPNGGYYSSAEREAVQQARQIPASLGAKLVRDMRYHSHPFLCESLEREDWSEQDFLVLLEGWQSDPNYFRLLLDNRAMTSTPVREALLREGRDWMQASLIAASTPDDIAQIWPRLARKAPPRAQAVLQALPPSTIRQIEPEVFRPGLESSHRPLRALVVRKIGHTLPGSSR